MFYKHYSDLYISFLDDMAHLIQQYSTKCIPIMDRSVGDFRSHIFEAYTLVVYAKATIDAEKDHEPKPCIDDAMDVLAYSVHALVIHTQITKRELIILLDILYDSLDILLTAAKWNSRAVEFIDRAACHTIDAIVSLQNHRLAKKTSFKLLRESPRLWTRLANRAAFIAAGCMIYASSYYAETLDVRSGMVNPVSPSSLRVTLQLVKLISETTPLQYRNRAVTAAITRFDALAKTIQNALPSVPDFNIVGVTNVCECASQLFMSTALAYSDEEYASAWQKDPSSYTTYFVDILPHEASFYAHFIIYAQKVYNDALRGRCQTSDSVIADLAYHIGVHLDDAISLVKTLSDIDANMSEYTTLLHSYRFVLNYNTQSANTRKTLTNYVTHKVLLGLKASLDALGYYADSRTNSSQTLNAILFSDDRFHYELFERTQNALELLNICIHRAKYMLFVTRALDSAFYGSKSLLPLYPGEIPPGYRGAMRVLKDKTLVRNDVILQTAISSYGTMTAEDKLLCARILGAAKHSYSSPTAVVPVIHNMDAPSGKKEDPLQQEPQNHKRGRYLREAAPTYASASPANSASSLPSERMPKTKVQTFSVTGQASTYLKGR